MENHISKLLLFIVFSSFSANVFSQQIGTGLAPQVSSPSDFFYSGVYSALNLVGGGVPDNTHSRIFLSVIRHFETTNNYQLQIASSFTQNDRLFFRKIAGPLQVMDPAWNEIATRGINTFTGNQIINGNLGIGTATPRAILDMGANISNAKLGSVFGRMPEGNDTGDGTYLGVKGYETQITSFKGKSFSIEHSFYGQTNSSINFFRGYSMTGGFITFNTNNNTEQMRIDPSGNVGIGTTTPSSLLDIYTNLPSPSIASSQAWTTSYTGYNLKLQTIWNDHGINQQFVQKFNGSDYNVLSFSQGNVGIGTDLSRALGNKLEVNGTIRCKEVLVEASPWPDYVFSKDYKLKSISEVDTYIKAHNHLPDMPTASDAKQNGVELGEMNTKLLQKVEELTLYIIQQSKEHELLRKEFEEYKKQQSK